MIPEAESRGQITREDNDVILFDVACMLNHAIILNHFDQAHAKIQCQKVMDVEGDKQISVIEGAVFYVDPKSAGSLSFLGGKERVRIPLTEKHFSLEVLKKHVIDFAGLKIEAEKRGLGSLIEVKLCRLAKTTEGSKAFSINTQAQWDVERPLFGNSSILQGGYCC